MAKKNKEQGRVTMDELSSVAASKVNSGFAQNLVAALNRTYAKQKSKLQAAITAALTFLQNWTERRWPKVTEVMNEVSV